MKQCERGHFYDETRYETCRYCSEVQQGVGATVGLSPAAPVGATVPLRSPGAGVSAGAAQAGAHTVAVMRKAIGFDPPVAFLVVTDGPHRGEHFALKAGRSFIGRAADADVSLPSDDTVSREAHALISYDQKANSFLIAPGQSRGLTYLGDRQVVNAESLEPYGVIEVGKTKAVFLPLCGPHFRWE
ncbi:MAG: FHA domain-containing protein [Bifidobacteriaceae bacterium]|jgi:hypothetical protein|nr:FHA domain-containing protein [Bifidobacteriaceae bacterium]